MSDQSDQKAVRGNLPDKFAIVDPYVLVPGQRTAHGACYGVLADHPRFGRIVRWSVPGVAGPIHGFRRLNVEDPARPAETLRAPIDEVERLLRDLEEMNSASTTRCRTLKPSPAELEVARFKSEWPHVAQAIGLEKPRLARLFDPGDAWVPIACDKRVLAPPWAECLERHTSGDFGLVGSFNAGVAMDEASLFTADLDNRVPKNSRAILLRAGLVVSVFALTEVPTPGLAVVARTALVPGREPVTLMTIGAAATANE